MDKTAFNATCLKEYQTVIIGRQMENNYRQFTFNCAGFGGDIADITLVHMRSQDTAPYIVASSTSNSLTWTVTNTDTAYSGNGQAELRITFADGLAKSVIFRTLVLKSITADTVIPEPLQSWYDAMIAYINEHSITDDQLAQAIADYLEEHPIDALVTSVNGQQGAVVLTASDVGAIADTVTIPTRTSQLQNDSGFISSVPVTSVNSKTGAVNLTASDVNALPASTQIPSKTSDLVNDSGFLSSAVTSFNGQSGAVTYTAPVTSVDGKTGAVTIMPSGGTTGQVLTKTASGTAWQTVSGGGAVDSVNGQTGVVVLDAEDVGALPGTTVIPSKTSDLTNDSGFITSVPVTSVNSKTGAVNLTASDVGAMPDSYVAPVTSVNGSTGAVTIANATTSASGLMSSTDKSHLDTVFADYSSALTALGVN